MNWFDTLLTFFLPSRRMRSTSTVRYAFPLFFTFAAILGASAILSDDATYIVVEAQDAQVVAGENFSVDVYVVAKVPVNAVDIRLSLPAQQVKVLGFDTGESVITLWTKQPYFENGTAHFTGGTYRKGFVGRHKIATVNAQALATGIAQIGVTHADLYAGDGTGAKVTVSAAGEDVERLVIAREDGTFADAAQINGTVSFSIVGDIDGDGTVTLTDISTFMSAWHSKSATYDLDGDARMSFRDFGIILAKYFLQ